jgi:PEP-CTERM motif
MKQLLCLGCGLLAATVGASAAPVFGDNFDSYAPGNLVGQGTWAQTGASVVAPIQVSSGRVALGPTGQDAYSPLPGGPITLADGGNFYIGLTLNVSAAATGDYFLHFTPTVGDTTVFMDRVFVQATTGGYLLGWVETSGGTTPSYGSTVLSLGTDYRVVVAYHDVAGTLNDTGALYVNPFTDPANEGGNTPYITKAWTSTSAENETIASINLRQGGGTSGPTLTIEDLGASQTFSDVTTFTPVPEPTSLSLMGGFGLLAWALIRRRK